MAPTPTLPDLERDVCFEALDKAHITLTEGPLGECHWDYRGRSTMLDYKPSLTSGYIVAEWIYELCDRLGIDPIEVYRHTSARPDDLESEAEKT